MDLIFKYEEAQLQLPEPLIFQPLDNLKFKTHDDPPSEAEDVEALFTPSYEQLSQHFQEWDQEEDSETSRSSSSSSDDEVEEGVKATHYGRTFEQLIYAFDHSHQVVKTIISNTKQKRMVYAAFERKSGQPVVIVIAANEDPGPVPKELKILAHVQGHPNIVEVLGYVLIPPKYYAFVMPYYINVEATLGSHVLTARYLRGVLAGLQHLKLKGVSHRDIATANIMWNPVEERAVIIDFDAASWVTDHGFVASRGRDNYNAPEKTACIEFRNSIHDKINELEIWDEPEALKKLKRKMLATKRPPPNYDSRADLYSVGVVFWKLWFQRASSPEPETLKRWLHKTKKAKKYKVKPALNLMLGLLTYHPERRITIEEALKHPFFTEIKHQADTDLVYQDWKQSWKQYQEEFGDQQHTEALIESLLEEDDGESNGESNGELNGESNNESEKEETKLEESQEGLIASLIEEGLELEEDEEEDEDEMGEIGELRLEDGNSPRVALKAPSGLPPQEVTLTLPPGTDLSCLNVSGKQEPS